MPRRTYEEMEQQVRNYFADLTPEQFQEDLKRSNFEFFNRIEDPILVAEGELRGGSVESLIALLAREGEIERIRLTQRGYQILWQCYRNRKWYDTIESPKESLLEALRDIMSQSGRDGVWNEGLPG